MGLGRFYRRELVSVIGDWPYEFIINFPFFIFILNPYMPNSGYTGVGAILNTF